MRLVFVLAAACILGLASVAWAGDYHVSGTLICSDCHVAHYSQSHALTSGGTFTPLGAGGPFARILRNEVNLLCLSCHNNSSVAPDVFGTNAGKYQGADYKRRAGALNSGSILLSNDGGFDDIDGHTLWSTATAPGGTFVHTGVGLECSDCHSPHGSALQYRNLRTSTRSTNAFFNKALTYQPGGSNDPTKDVWERNVRSYEDADVDFNEPDQTKSGYGAWCQSCHTVFHGSEATTNMYVGGDWVRHPTADANIEGSRLRQFLTGTSDSTGTRTNRVKVMDANGIWGSGSLTMTPSCFSCHRSHGNKNGFGLIFMAGNGSTVNEEGDGGVYRDLCRQCHTQGA